MNFDVGEEEKQVCGRIRDLFGGDAGADLMQMETLTIEDVRGTVLRWFASLADVGYFSFPVDGRHSVSQVVIQEQLAALAPALFLSAEVSTRIFGRLISVFGADEQKAVFLSDIDQGKKIAAVALSENSMNIENDPFSTVGVPSADGFRVTGAKGHVMNAPIADWIAVAGSIDGREGTAFFLIEKETPGLSIGDRINTLGYEGVAISPMSLDDCPVPAARVIHTPDGKVLNAVRMWEDEILTAASLGLMRRSFDAAVQHGKTHQTGGKPIIAYQEIGFKLAEMLTLLQTAQLLAYRAAWTSESGDREADVLAHSAKVFCGESAEKIASEAMQVLGGSGYVRGHPAETGYRDAKYIQIAGTSTEISRMKIGDRILGS